MTKLSIHSTFLNRICSERYNACCECVCSFINLRFVYMWGRVNILLVHTESITLILRINGCESAVRLRRVIAIAEASTIWYRYTNAH